MNAIHWIVSIALEPNIAEVAVRKKRRVDKLIQKLFNPTNQSQISPPMLSVHITMLNNSQITPPMLDNDQSPMLSAQLLGSGKALQALWATEAMLGIWPSGISRRCKIPAVGISLVLVANMTTTNYCGWLASGVFFFFRKYTLTMKNHSIAAPMTGGTSTTHCTTARSSSFHSPSSSPPTSRYICS